MRIKHLLILLCCCFFVLAAQAKATFTANEALKEKGIEANSFSPLFFSPDGDSIAGIERGNKKDIAKGRPFAIKVLQLNRDLGVSRVRSYPLNIPHMGQACYTPDGKAIVFTTRAGASILKLDLASGKVSTIMEHLEGKPGFKCYPEVITLSGGKMLISGYFYDSNDYAGKNTISFLNPNKTGVAAFTIANQIQDAQFAVRKDNESFYEAFPQQNLGYMAINNKNTCNFYVWKGSGKPVLFDKGLKNMGFWGSAGRLLYSIERGAKSYDCIIYDGNAGKKITLAQNTKTPYRNLYLSGDGKTAIINNEIAGGLTEIYFARQSDNWQIKKLAEQSGGIPKGTIRVSADGSLLLLKNRSGLRVYNVR